MEHAHNLEPNLDLIRPWRRATIAITAFAAVELIVIAGIAMALLGKPLANHFRESAAAASTPRTRAAAPAPTKKPTLDRGDVSVIVMNGNGLAGAAQTAADKVGAKGYLVGNVGNAPEQSPRTLIMFRPGYAAEGARLARDLRVRVVRPLDGLHPAQLLGSHVVLILGK